MESETGGVDLEQHVLDILKAHDGKFVLTPNSSKDEDQIREEEG